MLQRIIAFILLSLLILLGYESRSIVGGSAAQQRVLKRYKHLRGRKMTFDQFCFPKTFKIQPQQEFAGKFMRPRYSNDKLNPRELLVFHRIGSGKTCLSIQITEPWTKIGRPLVLMPASLIPGYRAELRSRCTGGKYAMNGDAAPGTAEYRQLIAESDALIDSAYNIMSYNKFLNDSDVSAPIIVIDEVQNINSDRGKVFAAVVAWIKAHPRASVVIMSATPLFDSVAEIHGLARLLRLEGPADSPAAVQQLFQDKVSYFAGAPEFTYPRTEIKVVKCAMSSFQARWYKSEVEMEQRRQGLVSMEVANNFYIKSRQRSNVVYPRGIAKGLDGLTAAMIRNNLATYSTKMDTIMKKVKKGELTFIYSAFTGQGGIEFITKVLRAFGYDDYFVAGPGRRRYAIWSGDETAAQKDIIREVYNSTDNDNASQIQVVVGSPSIKEGVSLFRTRHVHVMELYWNHSRLAQIFGRASRYCSHKRLPEKDREVSIYLYAACAGTGPVSPEMSIDLYMLQMADAKQAEIDEYNAALIEAAVDKYLWK